MPTKVLKKLSKSGFPKTTLFIVCGPQEKYPSNFFVFAGPLQYGLMEFKTAGTKPENGLRGLRLAMVDAKKQHKATMAFIEAHGKRFHDYSGWLCKREAGLGCVTIYRIFAQALFAWLGDTEGAFLTCGEASLAGLWLASLERKRG